VTRLFYRDIFQAALSEPGTWLLDEAWLQAALPVHLVGIGVRSICFFTSAAFLASVAINALK